MKKKIRKKDDKKQNWYIIINLVLLVVFLFAVYQLGTYYLNSFKAKQGAEELANQVIVWEKDEKAKETPMADTGNPIPEDSEPDKEILIPDSIDFIKLWEQNKEIVAWLYCPGTVISYPVVHTTDNDKYLTKNLSLEYSKEGTLFVDAGNHSDFTDWNTIIYGHNMKNGAMFKTITYYEDEAYYKEHPIMYLYTPENRYEIHLFAGCVVDAEESKVYQFEIGEEKQALLNQLVKKSTFVSTETVSMEDTLVTLSTCSYEYENARYILMGKLVQW